MHVRPLVFSIPSTLALPTIPLEITEHPIARQASLDWWQSVSSWAELEKQVTHVAMRPSVARNGFDSPGWMSHVSRELGVPLVEAKERDSLQIIHPIEFAALVYVTPDIGIHNVDIDFTRPSYPGLSGSALLKEVSRDARDGFKSQGYSSAKRAIFSTIDSVMVNGVRGVYSSYSNIFVPGTVGHGSGYPERGDQNGDGYIDRKGMNVEHLWPQSYFNKREPMRSDVHHLFPTFMYPNNKRGRLPFGEVADEDIVYSTNAGAKASKHLFEPPNLAKGQVARIMFCFFAHHKARGILPSSAVEKFWHASLPTLMNWNLKYPPSDREKERNKRIQVFQGNRNPFVDDYFLAERIGIEAFRF